MSTLAASTWPPARAIVPAARLDGDDLVLAQLDVVADGGVPGRGLAQRAGQRDDPVAVLVPDGVSAAVLCNDARHAASVTAAWSGYSADEGL